MKVTFNQRRHVTLPTLPFWNNPLFSSFSRLYRVAPA
jgi:hypothetical protein